MSAATIWLGKRVYRTYACVAAKNLPQLFRRKEASSAAYGPITLTREDRMVLKFALIATPRVMGARASNSGFPLG